MNIRKLKPVIKKNTYVYVKHLETAKGYIYQQWDPDFTIEGKRASRLVRYEVFLKRVTKPHPKDTGMFDKTESFPHDEAFGKWAWSCRTVEQAIAKL